MTTVINKPDPPKHPEPSRQPRPPRSRTFCCPLCGGEATVVGSGQDREFVCLDCTRFTLSTDD